MGIFSYTVAATEGLCFKTVSCLSKMKIFIALAVIAVCSAAPIGDDHHHEAEDAVHAVFADRSRNSINSGGAESALEVQESKAAAFTYRAHNALMAKKSENAENAKVSMNAKFAYKAKNAKYADWAAHAKHISPTFPPKPHELEKSDDGSWMEEWLGMLPEKKEETTTKESNDFIAMKAKNAINSVYAGAAPKAVFAKKSLMAGKAAAAEKALIAGG